MAKISLKDITESSGRPYLPNGTYTLRIVDAERRQSQKGNDMVAIVKGKTAIKIVNTLIREKYISTLQHAADMGIELHKAELSLKYGFKYIQDQELKIS